MKPTKDGYYWLKEEGGTPEIVFVSGFGTPDGPMVSSIGLTGEILLGAVDGEWSGPLTSPFPIEYLCEEEGCDQAGGVVLLAVRRRRDRLRV